MEVKFLQFHRRFVAIIGNILSHYNTALFGLLAPFIAPLFFAKQDPVIALMLTYAMIPLGALAKPLGALFFGWIGDRKGRQKSLLWSLMGMAITSIAMGCLPTSQDIGIAAPCLLAITRMLKSFCKAGESTGASIFLLENTPEPQRNLMSSFYDFSSMSGILVASGLVTLYSMQGWMEAGWRALFWLGGVTAVGGLLLRVRSLSDEGQIPTPAALLPALKEQKGALLSIMLASGFSYATYALAFTLMNGYVPLVTTLSKAVVTQVNTLLLVIDMLLLPCFGLLAHKFGREKIMITGAICSVIGAIPLFACLEGANLVTVTLVRCAIVVFGVAFAAPYHAWKLQLIPPQYRYTILSLGCILGSQLIGAPTSVICLWLYHLTGRVWMPGLYLVVIGTLAGIVVYRSKITQIIQETT